MERAVILGRVSSKEQADEGYSLPAQIKYLQDYTENKFEVQETDVFEIKESASGHKQRRIFSEMMSHVKKNNIKIIVCEKADRLTRNFKDMVMIDEWLEGNEERQVHLVKDSLVLHKNSRSQEKLNWGIRILFAKNMTENLSEEVKKGCREKLSQGELPAMPKLGYKTEGDKGHRVHKVYEPEAKYIRKIFALYVTGNYSLKRLGKEMYDDGFRTRKDRRVSDSHIDRLLRTTYFYGEIEWMGKLHPGNHKPLVSKEIFDRVGALLTGKSAPKVSKHFYLFKGLFHCAYCGGLITWERHKGKVYGHCNYRYYTKCRKRTWVDEADIVDELVKYFDRLELKDKDLADWLLKALKESHGEEIQFFESTLEQLKIELGRIQQRMDRLYEDKLDGRINQESYDARFKDYTAQKQRVVEAIDKHSKSGSDYFTLAGSIYELGQKGRLIYESADPEQKRELLRLVFGKLNLDGTDLAVEYSRPFSLLATAVKMTNKTKKSSEKIFDFKIGNVFSELKQSLLSKKKNPLLEGGHSIWLGSWDSNPGPIG